MESNKTVKNYPIARLFLISFYINRDSGRIENMEGIAGDKIAVFHFNDAPAEPARAEQSDADRVYPGDGILDLKRMISILKDADYSGVISLELFNPSYWEEDPEEVARVGLEKMQAVLQS